MHRYRPAREYIDIYLKTNTYNGKIKIKEPHKCEELKWFSFNKLPDNIIPELKQAIIKINQKKNFSEFGWEYK